MQAIHSIPVDVVVAQLDSLWADLPPQAIKTGMLAGAETVAAVAEFLQGHPKVRFVLDPVMVATSGDRLLDEGADRHIRERLLPLCTLVTPNREEAKILTGRAVRSVDDAAAAARQLVDMGAGSALVKGGHAPDAERQLVDVFYDGDLRLFPHTRHDTLHTHGTGCTLSAAATACLAWGNTPAIAAERAVQYVVQAIATAPGLGSGQGPLNHFTKINRD